MPSMLRMYYCMQQWYGLNDLAMEEALYEIASMRRFAGFSLGSNSIPAETIILSFRHLLETHGITEKIFALINQYLFGEGRQLSKGHDCQCQDHCCTELDEECHQYTGF